MFKLRFLLFRNFIGALNGYIFWHRLTRHYTLKECAVILIPSPNKEYTFFSVKYLREMLLNNHFKKALILSNDKTVTSLYDQFNCKNLILDTLILSRKKVRELLDFYNANMYDTRFIVASLEEPAGRNALDYLNLKCISKEDLFAIAVYNITSKLDIGVEDYEKN